MIELSEYLDEYERSPFGRWFNRLDPMAAAKVTTALSRIQAGNMSNIKGVGAGVMEYRINFGPGYRVYFGKDGDTLIVLLGGGTKNRQEADIKVAHELWRKYRNRKG